MRISKLLGKTLREVPAEADTISHQLLLRAGMIEPAAAGVYSYLPLAWRGINKISALIREEMDAAGGQEIMMPVLQPLEWWEESGRDVVLGPILFKLLDRRDRKMVLAPTHEEAVTKIVAHNVRSYRDLPVMPYQLQTKLRDEPRPRGGILRVREFIMKDLYSFDADDAGLDVSYAKMHQAYRNIFTRSGLKFMIVEADSGAIGGKESLEFMVIADSGEDELLSCPKCHYGANVEKATSVKSPGTKDALLPLEEISTPGQKTIDDLAQFLKIPASSTMKTVFYMADSQLVFVTIRGDIEVNEVKLKNLLHCTDLRLATNPEVQAAGLVAGAASPVGLKGVKVIADETVNSGTNFVAGANKPETHLKNVNYPRDFKADIVADIVADIAKSKAGDGCPKCGTPLESSRGIEVGHIFKLGTFYSQKLGATFLDAEGNAKPIVMGCYGIGVGRILAAAIEQNHDEKGIIWPMPIAPYKVHLCPLSLDNAQVLETVEKLYKDLWTAGIDTIMDDRTETAGVKFNDADLLGMPVRVVVSPRSLEKGNVEVKLRTEKKAQLLPVDGIVEKLKEMVRV